LSPLKHLSYLYLACPIPEPSENVPRYGAPLIEYITCFALNTLLDTGCLKGLKYLTVAFRTDAGYVTGSCHLQVPTSLTGCMMHVSEKKAGRRRGELFGELEGGGWNGMVKRRTGLETTEEERD
jgi:hypothetical protein